jgi:hypothetical protein
VRLIFSIGFCPMKKRREFLFGLENGLLREYASAERIAFQ